MAQGWRAILFLLIFTPFFAESIASTSTPWYLFLNPVILLLMSLLYGVSVLVIRELWVRQNLDFGRFVLCGAIFASLNEGIVANTWFKERALGFTNAELVRFGSVNWHLVVNHTIFHTLFSMLIPILLSFILFPKLNRVTLLNKTWLSICCALSLFVVVANLAPKDHIMVANFGHRLSLGILLMTGAVLGSVISYKKTHSSVSRSYTSKAVLFMGIGFSTLFIFSYFVLPNLLPGWSIVFSLALLIVGIFVAFRIKNYISNDLARAIPLIAGLMLPSFVLSFTKLNILQPVVIALFLVYLMWLYRKFEIFSSID